MTAIYSVEEPRYLTVTTAATATRLTTLAKARRKLKLPASMSDADLGEDIDEATESIIKALNWSVAQDGTSTIARETVSESLYRVRDDSIVLARTPIVTGSVTVTEDDVDLESTDWRLDLVTGELLRLRGTLWVGHWYAHKLVVAYQAGWIMPGEAGRDLPAPIERACIRLMSSYYASDGRDPALKSVQVDGVGRRDYWVGGMPGQQGELPNEVTDLIAPYRRVRL